MAVKYIRTVVVDRHLAHSRQNRAVGSGGSADSCPSEVQHRDEELDDMDARDDGDVVDQSDGDVLAEVQPEGGHHPDNMGALASKGRQKRSNHILTRGRALRRSNLAIRNRQSRRHDRFLGSQVSILF